MFMVQEILQKLGLSQREAEIVIPKNVFNIREKIKSIHGKIRSIFSDREERLAFSEFLEETGEDRIAAFVSLLHLDNQQRIWLEQDGHFEEIWILIKSLYEKREAERRMNIGEITGFSQEIEKGME